MSKRIFLWSAVALLLFTSPRPASPKAAAGSYSLMISGGLLNRFGGTCGSNLGDSYDTFCPSLACSCLQYDDPSRNSFNGNLVGDGKPGTVHFTHDSGDHTGDSGQTGPGCVPVFGEVRVDGDKDGETIYFNGSLCDVEGNSSASNAKQKMAGGWEIHSSTHSIKAFGSFTGNFQFNKTGFSMSFAGHTE